VQELGRFLEHEGIAGAEITTLAPTVEDVVIARMGEHDHA
jgi:hypothetical protein